MNAQTHPDFCCTASLHMKWEGTGSFVAGMGSVLRENGKKGKKLAGFLVEMTKKCNPSLKDK